MTFDPLAKVAPESAAGCSYTQTAPDSTSDLHGADDGCAARAVSKLVREHALQYASPDEPSVDNLYMRLCTSIWRINPGRKRRGLPELVCPDRSMLIEAIRRFPARPLRRVRVGCLPECDWLSEDGLGPDLMNLLGLGRTLASAE